MARYKTVDIRIWMDEKFLALDEGCQLLFIYLLTSQNTTPIGTLSIPKHVLAAWLQKDTETISKRLDILYRNGLIKVSDLGLIWIRNYLKYNPPANPKVARGYCKFFDEMPECDLQSDVAKAVLSACKLKGNEYLEQVEPDLKRYVLTDENLNSIDTVSKPYRNQEQEQEQEQYQYINTNKQQTEICNEGSAEEEVVCSEDSDPIFDEPLSEQLNQLAIQQTNKVVDDPNAIIDPVQAIGIARTHGIKLPRTIDLENVCKRKILTVDNMRQCIRLAKRQGNSKGIYVIGIMKNAVNEPSQYHTEEYKTSQRVTLDDVDPNYVFGSEK